MKEDFIDSPFLQRDSCVVTLLVEKTDPNGKHLEYKDMQGAVFARMAKVYKKGGLFGLFKPVQVVTVTAPVDPTLRTFLFPALQHLRCSRNW